MRGDALAGSTRLHRLHRHASEPSGRQSRSELKHVQQYRRIAGVHRIRGHMCLPLKSRLSLTAIIAVVRCGSG
jgi:hypothetical protein